MKRIKIYDTQFAHGTALGSGDLKIYPNEFIWSRSDDPNDYDHKGFCFITESWFHMLDAIGIPTKIGLIIEPISISQEPYSLARNQDFQSRFDFILTHNQSLIDSNPSKFVFYPFMGCWIKQDDRMIYEKNKNISIIASDKRQTVGHNLRHEVISKYRDYFNGSVYGRGYNFVDYKLSALKDYRFQIVIENEKNKHWFTEKICDCFATGTIPIYWGTDSITDFYNEDGIIRFNNVEELKDILSNIRSNGEAEYSKRLNAIKDNLERSKTHGFLPDNYIFDWFKKQYNIQ